MSLLVIIEIKTTPENEATFLQAASALKRAASTEPGTLRYDWYTAQKPGHYNVVEEYVDADAAETHNNNVPELLGELFSVAELVSAQFFGEINKYIRDWITGRPGIALAVPLSLA